MALTDMGIAALLKVFWPQLLGAVIGAIVLVTGGQLYARVGGT